MVLISIEHFLEKIQIGYSNAILDKIAEGERRINCCYYRSLACIFSNDLAFML